ncbi:unnamed protein product [Gongylonema pulchrum]|uniref:Secreted protein n=1 Tax=Gongylonema pulchrum TaxID=637853 RepID=A0A183EBY6_9BILA|nr:unnamed protein product [Gongylonema pulchrum]
MFFALSFLSLLEAEHARGGVCFKVSTRESKITVAKPAMTCSSILAGSHIAPRITIADDEKFDKKQLTAEAVP